MEFRPTHDHAPANSNFELGPPPRSGPCGKVRKLDAATHMEIFKLPPPRGETLNRLHISFCFLFVDIAYRALHPHKSFRIPSTRFNIMSLGGIGPGIRSIYIPIWNSFDRFQYRNLKLKRNLGLRTGLSF